MPPPLGIIITVSVLVAAGIACYENPQVREWIDNSRRKIAVALHSLGDEVAPRPSRKRSNDDPSMREDDSEEAQEKRRQARAEILERGRILEEKRRRQKSNSEAGTGNPSQSFDTLVDKDGSLLGPKEGLQTPQQQEQAISTATELQPQQDGLTRRHDLSSQPPADLLTQLESTMQSAFELPPRRRSSGASSPTLSESHASGSLINLTPTSTIPDRDPSLDFVSPRPYHSTSPPADQLSQTEYFSPAASVYRDLRSSTPSPPAPVSDSNSSHNFYYAHPSNPNPFVDPPSRQQLQAPHRAPPSSAPSIAGSDMEHIRADEGMDTDGDNEGILSEFEEDGDGIRTPGSVWTEVESVISEQ